MSQRYRNLWMAMVLAILFLGCGTAQAANTAAFVGVDTLSQGTWHGVYGADGYAVPNDSQSIPAYTSFTFSTPSGSAYTWTPSTTDPRALQNGANTGRLASTWYGSSSDSFDMNITDGNFHQISLYVLDWGNGGAAETIQVVDGSSGAVLDTRSVTGFSNGEYLVWNISGHVKINVSFIGSSYAVLVSGVFWDADATTHPMITSVSPTSGMAGTQVSINGSNFGTSSGIVTFNGSVATTSGWTSTNFVATVPAAATSGPLVVNVGGLKNFPRNFVVLPTGWLDQDVGAVGGVGSGSYGSGTFTVKGSGNYIGVTADGMHFVYQPLSGDGAIVARVNNLQGGNSPQATVMIRETLNPNATDAYVFYTPNQAFLYDRPSTGAAAVSQYVGLGSTPYPYWTKLVRSGSTFTAYVSLDGVYWEQIGPSQTITMAQNVYIGLAVSSRQDPSLATATFDNVSVSSSTSPAPAITGVSTTTGSIGTQVIITGTAFGASQGSGTVYLNGIPVSINSWTASSITITIPSGATSGLLGVSVDPTMNASNPIDFEVTTQPLPSLWLDQDVAQTGTLGLAGSATYSSGVFTVKGAGNHLGGSADGMHVVYQSLSGDGTILARVTSLQGGSSPEAAVMVRETLDPAATEAFVYYTPNQAFLNYRPTTGASTNSQYVGYSGAPPYWIMLTRSGGTITGYVSPDGVYWSQIGASQSITMAQSVYVGLAVSSLQNSSLATVTFDNVQVMAGTPYAVPVVTSVSSNPAGPGYSIIITGSKFGQPQGAGAVYFNGVKATTISSWASGQIVATVPGGATTGPVTVVANGLGSNRTVLLTIYSPVISSLSPPFGSAGGIININGSGFTAAGPGEQVFFNGILATTSTWADTLVQAYIPAGASSGPLTVSVNGIVSPSATFTAIEPLSVSAISPTFGATGSTVTITGAGFGPSSSNSIVSFYGANVTSIISWTDTQIQVTVPAGAATGPVSVEVADITVTGPVFNLTNTFHLTDSKNNVTAYSSVVAGGQWHPHEVQGSGCSSCTARGNLSYTYDAPGNMLSRTDELGHVTAYTYDASGNVLGVTVPITSSTTATTTYTYNSFGEVLTATDPLGKITTNTYDSKGNLLTVITPAPGSSAPASSTQFAYNSLGELTSITDPLSNATAITYTAAGLISTITDAQSNVTTYQYDNFGNRTSVRDALSNVTNFAYDAMNRLTTITYPTGGGTTSFTYDIRGRRTSVTDQNGKTTSYAHDDADRLTSVTDAASDVTTYAYDTENNLTSITDANSHTTSFTYDAYGRLTQTNFPSGYVETYAYDSIGNLSSKTDRKNQAISYTYDQLNRLTQKLYPDSTTVNYTYDNDSRLTQVADPTGTYGFTFDNMGRLTNTTTSYALLTGRNFNTVYAYDAASNRTGFTDPESGATAYVYDALNRLQTLTPPTAYGPGNFGFTYDALSRRTGLTRPNAVSTTYAYDNLSRLLSVTHASSGTTLDGASYTVDAAGNRTSRTALPGTTATNFAYDNLYELLTGTQGSTNNESYTYDPVGNRLTSLSVSSYTTNSSNELTAKTGETYTYDNNGNTLTEVTSSGTTTFNWNYENRLTSVVLPGSGGTVTFKYDPLGRRIYKSSSTATSVYAYDGDNLIEETNSTGAVVARYSQTQNIDEPLAMLRSAATSYFHADGLGSVTSLSNAAGSIANTYTYDSFGKLTASTGSLVNPFEYTARESDSETGLYYYRARYYDPSTGRFVAEDPFGFRGGFNFFNYVGNSPPTFIDPLGLCHVEMHYQQLGGGKFYAHTYLLVNGPDTNGHYFYFRGGPEHGASSSGSGSGSGGFGNLIGTTGVYGPDTVDYDKNGTDLFDVLLDDGKPCAPIVCSMTSFTNSVNAAPGIPYDKETRNSNSFSYGAARAAGLNPGPPLISAPGWDKNLPLP